MSKEEISNEVSVQRNEVLVDSNLKSGNSTLDQIINIASQREFDIQKFERLIELKREEDRYNRQTEFLKALSNFKYICPEIVKKNRVEFKQTKYKYASLEDIVRQIKEPLKECGLVYRFENQISGKDISVTCILSHCLGHSEKTTVSAAPDTTGSKNDIQATGSTILYLQRYSLLGALGINVSDEDNDSVPQSKPAKYSADKCKVIDEILQELGKTWEAFRAKALFPIINRNVLLLEDLTEDECDKVIVYLNNFKGKSK